ncbi:glycosyltransferase [Moheibacter lacus]|uniref:Glycosyltransferase n=1 Tax=Moheibacter lacus TaxID=2745851 RepID=A0A838ZIW2_9FLAO|nr:glycosyltransferase [Moheibacter lacus]MBA5629198.1 glycosyltransferase [Moheibacter lacus]
MSKNVLVVDWLDLYGGAEKVITEIDKIFDFEKYYALTDIRKEEEKHKFFKNNPKIITTQLQFFGKYFRYLLPFFPYFVNQIRIDKNAEVIISSSHNIAKGVNKSNFHQKHISYIQSRNLKYIWDEEQLKIYFGNFRFLIQPFVNYLRAYDVKSAQKPDVLIANSNFQKEWIKKHYNRDSIVVYPPVNLSLFQLYPEKENYYVAVGRFAKMKRFDLLIKAFNQMPEKKLILIGDGELMPQFKSMAKTNIEFPGFLSSDKVYEYVKKAKASVYVGIEDFGIAAVESQSAGTPVIAYKVGGTGETIKHGVTGYLYNKQSIEEITNAVRTFETLKLPPPHYISEKANQFSTDVFRKKIIEAIDY